MKSYLITILPAEKILNYTKQNCNDLICDFSDKFRKAQYGITYERRKNNALFDQINMLLNDDYDPFCNDYRSGFFNDKLIILDFADVCRDKTKSEKMESTYWKLYHDGFLIDFGNGEEPVRFRYFEHSAGMVRNAKDYFIREDIKVLMEARIMLDMDFDNVTFNPAKYYAYRGLYLTDGWRIDGLELNEKTVVVIPDCNENLPYSIEIITGEKQDNNILTLNKKTVQAKSEIINLFDGQGIISFDYAEKINYCLSEKHRQGKGASSFQIRMPFAKGMLHSVDFKKFFVDELLENPKELYIKDCFGIPRDLSKAEIILTESQFKITKAMKTAYGNKDEDPMEAYFKGFHRYNHALYVHATDLSFHNSNKVSFNYQFINAIPTLKSTDFKELVENNIDPLFQLDKNGKYVIDFNNAEKIDHIKQALTSYKNGTKAAAVQLNPYFLREAAVRQELTDYKRSALKKLVSGHLRIDGVQKYITRDLLYFLVYMAKKQVVKKCSNGEQRLENTERFNEIILEEESFYLPGEEAFDEGTYYTLFRSPCYSKFEPVLLKYSTAKKDIYEEYFKHLKGCVFIARSSVSISQLGGADQDGDVCKIIRNSVINKAVKEYGYNNTESVSQRSAPVIKIPSITGDEILIIKEKQDGFDRSLNVCIKSLFDGFRSSIGKISNIGILLSKANDTDDKQIKTMKSLMNKNENSSVSTRYKNEYIDIKKHIASVTKKYKKLNPTENKNSDYFNISAYTTIIGGTVIDNAKTGFNPEYGFIIPKKEKAEYNEMVDKATGKISRFDFHQTYEIDEKEAGVYKLSNNGETLKIYQYDENVANIDNLPSFFAKHYSRVKDNSVFRLEGDRNVSLFKFQKDSTWKNDINDEKAEKLKNIISDYNSFQSFSKSYNRLLNNKTDKTLPQIRRLILSKYDSYESVICGETSVADALYIAEQCLPSELGKIESAFNELKENGWEFLGLNEEEKIQALTDTLSNGFSDLNSIEKKAIIKLFCDFRFDGYKLLPLLLKSTYMSLKNENEKSERLDTSSDSELLKEMKELYMHSKGIIVNDREELDENNNSIDIDSPLDDRMKAACRKRLAGIFHNNDGRFDSYEAIKYCWALKNHGGSFFWKMFNKDEISNAVYEI